MESDQKVCINCGRTLRGRVDKKFCDDYCRNNYNNRQNSDENNLIRNINNILRKNRRLLSQILGSEYESKKIPKQKILDAGFNFQYITHLYRTQKDQVYYFVYDYGYLPLENDWVLIVKSKNK